jgi:hypothetical protein
VNKSLPERMTMIAETARSGQAPTSHVLRWVAEEAESAYPRAVNLLAVATACLHQLSTDSDLEHVSAPEKYTALVSWLRRIVEQETGQCTCNDGVFEEDRAA